MKDREKLTHGLKIPEKQLRNNQTFDWCTIVM